MSELTMVLQCPDDLVAIQVPSGLLTTTPNSNNPVIDHQELECESPTSSSSVSSPSTSTTSSSSVTPNNDGDDKATETTPFIDPEDVIGRRVMFDLPPLMMDSGWGVPVDISTVTPETCSEIDFQNSPSVEPRTTDGHPFSNGQEVSQEFPAFMMTNGGSSGPISIQLQILSPQMSDRKDFMHTTMSNGTVVSSNRHIKEMYEDIGFIHWNWPLIRRCCRVTIISAMVGLLCIAIALIATAPKTCEPPRDWFQGGVFYEIIPKDFRDSDGDGIGDLSGIIQSLDYIANLGVVAVRLNSLHDSGDDHFVLETFVNHSSIDPSLGTMAEFEALVRKLHSRNIRVILDFNPVFVTMSHQLAHGRENLVFEPPNQQKIARDLRISSEFGGVLMLNLSHGYVQQEIQNAMTFWLSKGVDGFYMKYLEYLKLTPQILFNLLGWRSVLDGTGSSHMGRKILICSGKFIDLLEHDLSDKNTVEAFMGLFDLMEHQLPFRLQVIEHLPQEIDKLTSRQFRKAPVPLPWILWSIESVKCENSSDVTTSFGEHQSFAAVLFSLMLPGTVNVLNRAEMLMEDYKPKNMPFASQPLVPAKWFAKSLLNSSFPKSNPRNVSSELHSSEKDHPSFMQICKAVISLRNNNAPIFVSSMSHKGEHENSKIPNYKVQYCNNNLLVLERFYPRRNSFILMANFGDNIEIVDLSSKFYQGKIIVSTENKNGTLSFKNVPLKGGEVLIIEI